MGAFDQDRWGFKRFVATSMEEGFLRPPVVSTGNTP